MPTLVSQTPLTTVQKPILFDGTGASFIVVNHHSSDTAVDIYAVPLVNPSSTITDHAIYHATVAGNSTVFLSETLRVSLPRNYRLEAKAAAAGRITLNVTSG